MLCRLSCTAVARNVHKHIDLAAKQLVSFASAHAQEDVRPLATALVLRTPQNLPKQSVMEEGEGAIVYRARWLGNLPTSSTPRRASVAGCVHLIRSLMPTGGVQYVSWISDDVQLV